MTKILYLCVSHNELFYEYMDYLTILLFLIPNS